MMAFRKDFIWGAATASAQVEGGYDEGGRTPSIWDLAPHKKIRHGEDCHVSADQYHHLEEDVLLMKEMGLKAYRFSVSWSRVLPERGKSNPIGLDYYSHLIDLLLSAGIEPILTVYHWDLPLWAYRLGGWESKRIIEPFKEYTRLLVESYSPRVKYWIVANEPTCFLLNGYVQGAHAPFKKNPFLIPRISKVFLQTFHDAVTIIRAESKGEAKVGLAHAAGVYIPKSLDGKDVEWARSNSFEEGAGLMANRWFLDPLLLGKGVRAYGVYSISDAFARRIQVKLDFLGINCYSPFISTSWKEEGASLPGATRNSLGWLCDGRLLYWCPKFFYERYHLPIMVTENGYSGNDEIALDGGVHDPQRSDYLLRYLKELKKAADEGIPLLGYLYWSFIDNFEWAEGYDPRFGLVFCDFSNGKRVLKDSALAYKKIISANGESDF